MKTKLSYFMLSVLVLLGVWRWWLLPAVDAGLNQYLGEGQPPISSEAERLHRSLLVGDLHADSFLWARNLADLSGYGHLDLPRARAGNLGIQVFTAVTKSPRGLNYHENAADAVDNITLLAVAQGWPVRTWDSLLQRALYQGERLHKLAAAVPERVVPVASAAELREVLARRDEGEGPLAAILGIEGAHPLEGKLENIGVLYDAGFRVMGLQHFFDNELGGSLHGESGAGLTDFGRRAVLEMARRSIIIDVAHSSEAVVREVLALTERPLMISHTGLKGHCDSARNIPDALMQAIAAGGGLVGVGFWDGAICDPSPVSVVQAIRYAVDLLGVEHVALGSDYDGTVAVTFDAGELGVLTEEMLRQGFSEYEIRRVMGENLRDFLLNQLPGGRG
ncbi:hypothetical protein Maes01_01023 [Microbulbifer aestuariivivens]|uniref:Peptidase M19 n=1 Tax=Microbulbifer aestuariivivens TaxID=1908308 RepID=A0ABP9WPV4_9GAMM